MRLFHHPYKRPRIAKSTCRRPFGERQDRRCHRRSSSTIRPRRRASKDSAPASRKRAQPRKPRKIRALFADVKCSDGVVDEVFKPDGAPRPGFTNVVRLLDQLGTEEFRTRQRLADNAFLRGGITFSVYSDRKGVEKIFPFDLIPRVVSAPDFERIERGLIQRVAALNSILAASLQEELTRIMNETADVCSAIQSEYFDPPLRSLVSRARRTARQQTGAVGN